MMRQFEFGRKMRTMYTLSFSLIASILRGKKSLKRKKMKRKKMMTTM